MARRSITDEYRKLMAETFPTLNIAEEERQMMAWLFRKKGNKIRRYPSQSRFFHWLQKSLYFQHRRTQRRTWQPPKEWGQEPRVTPEQIQQLRRSL